ADGKVVPARPSAEEDRWSARLAHGDAARPALVEAPVPAPLVGCAASICANWTAAGHSPVGDAAPAAFVAALDHGDAGAVAAELAALGRSPIARGILGGDRQHERARSRHFADRLARWTYDKLLSL